jgi:hypothetical protein
MEMTRAGIATIATDIWLARDSNNQPIARIIRLNMQPIRGSGAAKK